MEIVVKDKLLTVAEYFTLEETSEVRHEYINGQLFEMPGATKKHNLMVSKIQRLLEDTFTPHDYLVYRENMKVKITGEAKYYYPDIFITREQEIENEPYACHQPVLIVEVKSSSTGRVDSIDKLINYQKIPSLRYYILADPERIEVIVFTKDSEGGWLSEAFTTKDDVINLKKLDASFSIASLYTII